MAGTARREAAGPDATYPDKHRRDVQAIDICKAEDGAQGAPYGPLVAPASGR